MATFEVKVYKLEIEPHPNADRIELAKVGEYRSVVGKGQYTTGDLGVYIPEAAIVPEWMLKTINMWDEEHNKGKLAGKNGDRVKAIKLRGIMSQGLIFPLTFTPDCIDMDTHIAKNVWVLQLRESLDGEKIVTEGEDVTKLLKITKYEPPIPTCLNGEVIPVFGKTLKYDIENWKRFPDVLQDEEDVVMTEKLHGSWTCFGYHPDIPHPIVTSKGLSDRGLIFDFNADDYEKNTYIQSLNATKDSEGRTVLDRMHDILNLCIPFYILGETFGPGIQDLTYGLLKKEFRVFDMYIGNPGQGRYVDVKELITYCKAFDIDMVPILYQGPFTKDIMMKFTTGTETVSGSESNIREGIVITPVIERRDDVLGRVKLKSISDNYLDRKHGTEYT